MDINSLLHDCRSACLHRRTPLSGTLLSAGCAGSWYFDWISSKLGYFTRHIGLEYYSPIPDFLPSNVDWISNTVSDMSGVVDEECDHVFSGQNIEHLWPEEVVGFLCESNRVLRSGGTLIIDSPNRIITEALKWSHPEHTIEFTPDEAVNLVKLAGFCVTSLKGIWLCKNHDGKILPLQPDTDGSGLSLAERILLAESAPSSALLWWIEARKIKPPQREALKAEVDFIFSRAWQERCQRFQSEVGTPVTTGNNEQIVCEPGVEGALLYGPYVPLPAGKYYVVFHLSAEDADKRDQIVAQVDIMGSNATLITWLTVTPADIECNNGRFEINFELKDLEFGIQARCLSFGVARITLDLPVEIKSVEHA